MQGYLSLVLHAHLPFVRHPEHEKFLEESWLFEAVTETYIPLLQIMEGWRRDGVAAPLTLSLSPPLCAMLRDPLLRNRYERHLNGLIELAEKEIHRTHWDRAFRELAWMYHQRFTSARDTWHFYKRDLVGAFRQFQDEGRLEIITTAATHALAAVAGESSAVPPRANFDGARPLPQLFWPRSARHLAAGMRLRGRRRNIFAGGEHPVVHSRHARRAVRQARARVTARLRRFSRPTASPPLAATSIPRARSGAGTKVIRATRATAIFTATSASTSISIT